ncbi:MAG: hypothetical protein HKN12_00475, partial [Gemmatimonadetes bacterium]|nr:hypothetical protein [Gemmatimonadota bacterium]
VEDFEGPTGTVVAGDLPQGGSTSGMYFPGITITATNTAGGPNSAVIFDTENPGGGDEDLGTPNSSCGGPGLGTGGTCTNCGVADPTGPNCVALGKALIIAENLNDANADNVVDDPDDERGGGTLVFEFASAIVPIDITILDIDSESAAIHLRGDTLCVVANATDLGNNSAQTIDLQGFGTFDCLEVTFSSSGAVAELEYDVVVSVEEETWGKTKAAYRKED